MVGLDPANGALTVSGLVPRKKCSTKIFFKFGQPHQILLLLLTLSAHSLLFLFLTLIDRVSPAYTPYSFLFVIDKAVHRL